MSTDTDTTGPNAVPYVDPDEFFLGPSQPAQPPPWTKVDHLLQTAATWAGKEASKLSGTLSWLYKIWQDPEHWRASLGLLAGVIFVIVFALFGGFGGKPATPHPVSVPPILRPPPPPRVPPIKLLDDSVHRDGDILLSLGVSKDVVQTAVNATLIERGTPLADQARARSSTIILEPNSRTNKGTTYVSRFDPPHYANLGSMNGSRYLSTLSHDRSTGDITDNSAVVHEADPVNLR